MVQDERCFRVLAGSFVSRSLWLDAHQASVIRTERDCSLHAAKIHFIGGNAMTANAMRAGDG